jgi:hypothetical protein
MAGNEHQPEQVIIIIGLRLRADAALGLQRVVEGRGEIRSGLLPDFQFAAHFFVLAIEQASPPQHVDRAMLGGGHQPSPRIVGHTGIRPLFQRHHQSFLRKILGDANVAHDAGEPGNQLRGLNPPDRVDSAMGVSSIHVIDHIIFPYVSASRVSLLVIRIIPKLVLLVIPKLVLLVIPKLVLLVIPKLLILVIPKLVILVIPKPRAAEESSSNTTQIFEYVGAPGSRPFFGR